MSKSKFYLCAGIATVILLPSLQPVAQAQMDGGYPNLAPSTMDTYMSSHIGNLSVGSVVRRNRASIGRKAVPIAPKLGSRSSTATTYRSTPAVTQKVIRQYISWARTQSPKEADSLKSVFARYNPVQIWSGSVKSDGLKTGDVTDSLAAYWILNYLIANQKTQNTKAQALAVRDQVRPLLSSASRLTSAQKQELSEVWMVNFVVQQGAFSAAMKSRDKALMQKLSDSAVTRFQNELGVNLRTLQLTDEGFVAKT